MFSISPPQGFVTAITYIFPGINRASGMPAFGDVSIVAPLAKGLNRRALVIEYIGEDFERRGYQPLVMGGFP
jgi:hypothetical protein